MAGNQHAPYLGRIIATRDLVLACGVIGTEGDIQRQWLLAGLVCDCADTLAAIAGGVGGYLPKRTSALMTRMALGAAVLGVGVLREQ